LPRGMAAFAPDGLSGTAGHDHEADAISRAGHPRRRRGPSAGLASQVLEYLPAAVMVLDADLRLRHWNRQAMTLLDAPSFLAEAAPGLDELLAQAKVLATPQREAIEVFCREQIPGDGIEPDSIMRLHYGRDGRLLLRLRGIPGDRWLLLIEEQLPADMFEGPDTWLDALTGVTNRRGFQRALEMELNGVAMDGNAFLVMIDLDHFASINGQHQRVTGDAILALVARRLRREIRDGDLIARHGGDTFVILARNTTNAVPLAGRILDGLSNPFQVEGKIIDVSASIGMAGYPAHGATVQAILASAESALRTAKRAGGGRWAITGHAPGDASGLVTA
jgi:diguanylate cyclase (GGDEF)-like protein